MSLKVWLPLNGDTKQQGTSDIIMSGSPNSWGTSGKIGKCATFAGNASNVVYNNTNAFNYTDNFSWCVWINTNFTGSTAQYAFTVGRADAGGYGYALRCASTTECHCRYGNMSYTVSVTGGTWTHIAFTKSGSTIKIYKNGALYSTNTFSGSAPTYSDGNGLGLGCFHYSGNIYPFYGSLNDFRIYDHCLSQEEVREIAKGLVLHYPFKMMHSDGVIYDCSGFGNDLIMNGANIFNEGTGSDRYENCVSTSTTAWSTSNQPTLKNRVPMRTMSIWFRPNTHASTTIASLGGVWLVRTETADKSTTGGWVSYNGVNKGNSGNWLNTMDQAAKISGDMGKWIHACWCFDATSYRLYKNGTLLGTYTYNSDARKAIFGTNDAFVYSCFTGAWVTPSTNNLSSYSDFRLYSTSLTEEDVKLLYSRGASIDNTGKLHCGEITEGKSKIQVEKSTEVNCSSISEVYTKYDNTLYTEPDGSKWLRVSHHNNPASIKFTSTDSFTTNVYRSTDVWFNVSLCNYLNKWELMVKQKTTSTASEQKFRWVQSVNPMKATFAQTTNSLVTYNTNGYSTSGYGGLLAVNGATYLAANNGVNGNWYGAIGCWTAFNAGIPGWNGVTISSGYIDLYVRVDNVTFTQGNTKTQFLKEDNSINTAYLIES